MAFSVGLVPRVEEVVVERVGAAAGQPDLGHVAVHRERHLELDHGQRDRVARRADVVVGAGLDHRIRHVALVVGGVEMQAGPATGCLHADVELRTGGAVLREVDVAETVTALPALDPAGMGTELLTGLRRVADHVPQALGEGPDAGVVGDAGLVVDDLVTDRQDLSVTVEERRHPVRGRVAGHLARRGSAGQGRRGARRVRGAVSHEGVVVRPARLPRVDDRVDRRGMGHRAVGLELVEVARRRGPVRRGHARHRRIRRDVAVAVGVVA
ncbi:hypothetical protein RKD30_006563 [Streptomyces pristinaespiralis]